MTFEHLTSDPDFRIDPDRQVIGWGVKDHAPSEAMTGVLYVTDDAHRWTYAAGWDRRGYVATIEVSGVEGTDFHTLSDRETLVVNLDSARLVGVRELKES